MGFHCGAILRGCSIGGINAECCVAHGAFDITLFDLFVGRALYRGITIQKVCDRFRQDFVSDRDILRCVSGLLKGFCDHEGNGLTKIGHVTRPLNRCFVGTPLRRVTQHPLIGNDRQHTG